MRFLQLVFRYTLNNVVFGIALLILIALYIAIGSGSPSLRAYFELGDLEFFDAWPLKLLMFLMCATLAVVTWNRIPLTPPRYGVWCIHSGIITLIVGMSLYYHFKVEGKTLIPIEHTVNYFYDSSERAIYARVLNHPLYGMHPLPSLPRFDSYDPQHDADRLNRSDLTGIESLIPIGPEADAGNQLSQWLGVQKPVRLDIVGFYPYADVVQDFVQDPASTNVGVQLSLTAPHAQADQSTLMLTASDPTAARQMIGSTELEHRNVSDASLDMVRQSTNHILHLQVTCPGQAPQTFDAQLGQTFTAPGGYHVTIDSFNPAFPMSTGEIVRTLTLHLVSDAPGPKHEFWRMILENRPLQTDFKMDPANTPPMVKGNRQKEPIDKDLSIAFAFSDPAALLPNNGGTEKHTFITAGDKTLLDVFASFNGPVQIKDFSAGDGQIHLSIDGLDTPTAVRRLDHFKIISRVVETPPARRSKDEGDSGIKQVAVVRVTCGDWSQDVVAPCDLYPAPDSMTLEPMAPWSSGVVQVPGATDLLQLQLGFTCRPLPAALRLRKFEMVHYPGGKGSEGPFRDFRSTMEMTHTDGEREVAVASLNSPIYFDGGRWIFFQAGYDPDGQASTIGVGNRPGVYIMITGCIMIVLGLMYAFYVKPLVIRRMKANALARHAKSVGPPARKESVKVGA